MCACACVCLANEASLCLCVTLLCIGTITQPEDEWVLWMKGSFCVCVFAAEWTGRASGGDREEEQGDVGKWFSRWDPICETMHPKETFSHGPTTWIQIHPATRSELEGRMHLALTHRGEAQPSSFFVFFTSTFTSIQSQNSTEVTSWQLLWVIHSYHCPVSESVLLLYSVMGPRIYNDGVRLRARWPKYKMMPTKSSRWVC